MATVPQTMTLTKNSVDILNAIRNGASANYRDYVPQADNSLASIKEIGGIIMQFPALQNEFLSALINRIGRVMITSKMYSNPWTVFKQGIHIDSDLLPFVIVADGAISTSLGSWARNLISAGSAITNRARLAILSDTFPCIF